MSLIHNNIPFLVLNFNLKSGLLTGALAVSLATGAITLVNHQDEIKSRVEQAFDPVKAFVATHFATLQTGAIEIAKQGKEWAELVQEKVTSQLTSLTSKSQFLDGAQAIQTQWKAWFDDYKNKPSDIFKWVKELDQGKLTEYAKTIHTFVKTIYETLGHISALFNHLKKMFESQESMNEVNSHSNLLGSLLQIAQSSDSGTTLQNLGKTILENSNVSLQLGLDNFAAIIGLAAGDAKAFNDKIQELSKPASSSSSSGTWGKYASPEELMAALGLKDALKRKQLVDKIVKVTKCPNNQTCGTDYNKIIKDFFDSVKGIMTQLKSKDGLKEKITDDFLNKFTDQEYFLDSSDNKVKQLVDSLIEKALASNTQLGT